MKVPLRDVAFFVLLSILTSILLNPLRHPVFESFGFNGIVVLLELITYVFLVRKGSIRISAASISIFAILGYGISIVTYAFTSIVLDKFGLTGLYISIAHSGLPNYLINLLFVSLFSYCWLQLPVAVVLQAYLPKRAAERRSIVKQRPPGG